MTKKDPYWLKLNDTLDLIYDEASNQGFSFPSLAEASGLSISTIHRLNDRLTEYPRFHTVYRLATAVGIEVTFVRRQRAGRKTA